MFSKNWKLALVVSLSATLLTACGSDNKKEESPANPLAGAYVNETALGHYKQYSVEAKNDAQFCKIVLSKQFRGIHGVGLSNNSWNSEINAISIDNAGNVRRFELVENRATRPAGAVSFTGEYTGSAAIASLVPVKALLSLDSKTGVLSVKDLQTRKSANYVRSDRATVLAYLNLTDNCVFDKEGKGAYDYEENGRRYFLDDGDQAEIEYPEIQGPGDSDEDLDGGKDDIGFLSDEDLELED